MAGLVHKRALGMLWSSGRAPSAEERARLRNDAWRHRPADLCSGDAVQTSACDLLEQAGYAPDRGAAWDLALPEVAAPHLAAPKAGHALRLTARWSIAPAGTVLTLSSTDVLGGFRIGRGGHYMEHDGRVRLSCGGPSSFLALDVRAMVPTGEIVRMPFWRFAELPGAGEGVDFTRPVAVWEWDGDDADFLERATRMAA